MKCGLYLPGPSFTAASLDGIVEHPTGVVLQGKYLRLLSGCQQNLVVRLEARRGLVEYRCGSAGEGFVVGMVEGIDAELDQAGGQ